MRLHLERYRMKTQKLCVRHWVLYTCKITNGWSFSIYNGKMFQITNFYSFFEKLSEEPAVHSLHSECAAWRYTVNKAGCEGGEISILYITRTCWVNPRLKIQSMGFHVDAAKLRWRGMSCGLPWAPRTWWNQPDCCFTLWLSEKTTDT